MTTCEDADKGCPVHEGAAKCDAPATIPLMRIDMEDTTGTWLCEACAKDALESGVFRVADVGEQIRNRR